MARLIFRSIVCFLCLWFLICDVFVRADNPTAIVKPYDGPDPGYILAESDSGLSNRLRVLAAYMYVGDHMYAGAHLAFVWDVNSACPGHFLELFQPIEKVMFVTNSSRYVLDKGAKIVYENSWAVFHWTLSQNGIPRNKFGQPNWGQIEYNMYSRFWPTQSIMQRVTDFVRRNKICDSSAMHIRLTDMSQHMKKKRKTVNLQSYFDFVETLPANEAVYLLTDNAETQKVFLDKYGPKKILVYALIPMSQQAYDPFATPGSMLGQNNFNSSSEINEVTNSLDTAVKTGSGRAQLPSDHRHTSLEHALIDVLIAAHAKDFKAGIFSSLSDLVNMLKQIGRKDRGWCGTGYGI